MEAKDPSFEYEQLGCLHEIFVRQARSTPEDLAVWSEEGSMTFKELDEATDLLASALRRCGASVDKIVGIFMEKSLEFVVAYIAILKAGAAYLPIETSYPQPMVASVIEDAEPIAVVTSPDLIHRLTALKVRASIRLYPNDFFEGGRHEVDIISLGPKWQEGLQKNEGSPTEYLKNKVEPTLDSPAFVVYSSGTTGKPKGIRCTHRAAVFSYTWRHVYYPYSSEIQEREACNVFFVWELLRPLLKGVPLYVIPNTVIYDANLLCEFIKRHGITRMLFTPSLLEAVLDTKGDSLMDYCSTLRQIWLCGEVVTAKLRNRIMKALPNVSLPNLYSISEAHDVACCDLAQIKMPEDAKFCPVGKLLPGVAVAILGEKLQLMPVGISGEIYIGGPGLALGYIKRPDLNQERFIDTPKSLPASFGKKIYRTGDWGYLLANGQLEICGRCDSMVKIRGYSVETQAIEKVLLQLPFVNKGCVLACGEEGTDKFLVAYVALKEGFKSITSKQVKQELKKRLPFYMVPSRIIFLQTIPVLPASGKLDKKALPKVTRARTESGIEPDCLPRTNMEKAIAEIWCEILQLNVIDVQESFFDLGGHSLLATRLLNSMNDKFGTRLTVKELFDYPTIGSLAAFLDPNDIRDAETMKTTATPISAKLNLKEEVEKLMQGLNVLEGLDIQLRAFWRAFQLNEKKWSRCTVLLTGSTGFLGAFLLRDLLTTTKSTVYCLVRDLPDGISAEERLRRNLKSYGILESGDKNEDEVMEKRFQARVVILKGDVGLVNMGLAEDDFSFLTSEIDLIIHAAAWVNLVYPYHALQGTNCIGTQNVLMLACETKIKPIFYISTDAVFPPGLKNCSETEDMTKYHDKLTDGYSQSKWVAEQLMLNMKEQGLPVAVFRCGNMGGSTKGAYWNPADFTLTMMVGCLAVSSAPLVDWQVEVTPVDFISGAVVKLTQSPLLALGKVFHVVNPKTLDSRLLWQFFKGKGYNLAIKPFDEWKSDVESGAASNDDLTRRACRALLGLLNGWITDASFFADISTYTSKNFQTVLEELSLTYPPVDINLIQSYFEDLTNKRSMLPSAAFRTSCRGPPAILNKVAVVTGASSGIGAAIATALAENGAKVAMTARRLDRLQTLQKKISEIGGNAVSFEQDVTNRTQVKSVFEKISKELGPIDILVNNAGCMMYTFMRNLHEDEWKQQVDVNIMGTLNCIGATLSSMTERKTGHIVNISSDAGRKPFPGLAVYSGTKYFIEGFSGAMRQELADTGVKVTTIQPGDVATEINTHCTDQEARESCDGSSKVRILDVEDVAAAVVFALNQPRHCAVNEILIEPREAPA